MILNKSLLGLIVCFVFSIQGLFGQVSLELEKQFIGHQGPVEYVAFTLNGSKVVTAGHDGKIIIWNLQTGQVLKTIKAHQGIINMVDFSSDGSLMASASDDGTVKIWDISSGRLINTFANAQPNALFKEAYFVTFSPDGRSVYFGGKNKKIRFAGIRDANAKIIFESDYNITSGILSPDSRYLVFGTAYKVAFMRLDNQQVIRSTDKSGAFVNDIAFTPAADKMAVWCEDGKIMVWSYPGLKLLSQFKAGAKGYSHIDFSHDGKHIVSGNSGSIFNVWNIDSKRSLHIGQEHRQAVKAFHFSPNGKYLLTGAYDGLAQLYKFKTGVFTPPPKPKTDPPLTPMPRGEPEPPKEVKIEYSSKNIATKINNRNIDAVANIRAVSDTISIRVWDDEEEDGDIISLYFNDKLILDKYSLVKKSKEIILKLEPNSINSLILYAHNVGSNPPNTAALMINNGEIDRKVKLSSTMKSSEAINIMYYPK